MDDTDTGVSRESPRAFQRQAKQSRNSLRSLNSLFRDSGDCFETLLDPGAGMTRWTLWRLLRDFGPGGAGDSCKGGGLQARAPSRPPKKVYTRKWPRSLFRPVQARSWKEKSPAGWDQDGPGWPPPGDLDGSEMLENKAHGESGRDPFGPGMGPGRAQGRTQARVTEGLDGTPRDSSRLLGLSDTHKENPTRSQNSLGVGPLFSPSKYRGKTRHNEFGGGVVEGSSHSLCWTSLCVLFACSSFLFFIDLLMGLFRGAVFRHGGGALKQPK